MRAQMAEITASNLGGRIPEPGTGDEIDRLAQTMNETLARVEDAVRHQQRFVADASHELRSPLTRIRTELEVDLSQPDQDADPIATERSVLAETIGLQRLVDDLLHLARSDAAATEFVGVSVDLDDIVLSETRRLAERGQVMVDSRQRLGRERHRRRPASSRRAVQNLLDNAERHASTTVTITLAETDGLARLTVTDDGAGIPQTSGVRCSNASLGSTKPGPATPAARDSDWRSHATSSNATEARSDSPTSRPRRSSSNSRPAADDGESIPAQSSPLSSAPSWSAPSCLLPTTLKFSSSCTSTCEPSFKVTSTW